MNKIIVEVSIGELLDKISILEIKKEKIKDTEKLKFINNEHSILKDQLEKSLITIEKELKGASDLLILLNEENEELSPLIQAGALGASEKFRLKRETAKLIVTKRLHNAG